MPHTDFANDPAYKIAYEHVPTGQKFYQPADLTAYHKSREMAMSQQDAYSRCGISREALQSVVDTLLEFANNQLNKDTLRTDLGVIANNLKYRMSNIADEICALRMGAIACFIDNEDPDTVVEQFTAHKIRLAMQHPDIYAFFLHTGIAFIAEYATLLRGLEIGEYFKEREMNLNMLTLKSTPQT